MITPQGENSIIGVPRANTLVSPGEVTRAEDFIVQHEILLLQLEIPLAASLEAVRIAHQSGLTVIFNPAPAIHPLDDLLPCSPSGEPLIDWIMPNEVEAEMLSGVSIKSTDDAVKSGKVIRAHGVHQGVVITMGSQGIVGVTSSSQFHIPAFHVTPVDLTCAGDAFCGAFAAALSDGQSLEQSIIFANAAGTLAVTVGGAEPSLPMRSKIEAFLQDNR